MYYIFCLTSSLIFLYFFVGGVYVTARHGFDSGAPVLFRSLVSLAIAVGCYVRARQDRDDAQHLVANLGNLTAEEAEGFLSESATPVYHGYERRAPGERFFEYKSVRFGVTISENKEVLVRVL
ncbi:MAG: hypothetical protein U1F61_04255 [Opitutaceae bacterium]